jgi:hypothetical protein
MFIASFKEKLYETLLRVNIALEISSMIQKYAIIILIGLTAVVYSNSLANGFVWDDYFVIVDNNFVTSWSNLPRVFSKNYFTPLPELGTPNMRGSGETTYRPVVTLSYFFDYRLWQLNAFGYHLTSLALHILNVLLLYVFGSVVIRNRQIAFVASLLFAIHPVNTEAVNVISFREELLFFLFYISSFILYVKRSGYSGYRRILCNFFSIVSFLLALFSKEMAVTLPCVLVLHDFFFVYGQSWKKLFEFGRRRYAWYAGAAILYGLVWFWLRRGVQDIVASYPYPGGSLYTNLLTMTRALGIYLGWLLFPVHVHATLPENNPWFTSYSLFQPPVLLSLGVVMLCLFCAYIIRKRAAAVAFFMLWFFVALAPVSNMIPIATVLASRYLYLPAAGFCMVIAIILKRLPGITIPFLSREFLRKSARSSLIVLIVFYALFTGVRNLAWRNNVLVWQELCEYSPGNPDAHANLGMEYLRAGLADQAFAEGTRAIFLAPGFAKAYNVCGLALGGKGLYLPAIRYFSQAVSIDPNYTQAYFNLGVTYARAKKNSEARTAWEKLLSIDPGNEQVKRSLRALGQEDTQQPSP